MKKLLLIFIFALIGCTADEAPRECDCRLVEHGSSTKDTTGLGLLTIIKTTTAATTGNSLKLMWKKVQVFFLQ
jgi:hypothetical protein